MRTQVKRAFTLIEILIVVVILGILAAIVIPQFTDASQRANDSSVRSQLQTIRGQIELYRVNNNGVEPPSLAATGTWDDLMVPPNGEQPYIQTQPRNPLMPGLNQTSVGTSAGPTAWFWMAGPAGVNQLFANDGADAVLLNADGTDA